MSRFAVPEERFLQTIRDAIRRQPGGGAALPADRDVARLVRTDADVVEHFVAMAADAKMKVYRIAGESTLAETVLRIVHELGATSVLLTQEPIPRRDAIEAALRDDHCRLVDPRAPDSPFEADVGITGVRVAIAETGSIVVASGPLVRRLGSLAVPAHVAIVRKAQIVADLLDWAASLGGGVPANDVLITGPSKTADIEMNLVLGVHGPGKVYVVLVE